tara:strand:- start:3042 stop:5066 length:2025 start_codon:yes stop_codon:yes gene_type:complete
MATSNNITIKFLPSGDKALKTAITNLAIAQERLEKKTRLLGSAQETTGKKGRLLNNSLATMRSKLLLVNFAMAMGIKQLIGFIREASKVDSMSRAFNTLAGATENSRVALSKLKSATNDTMSEFDLFQQANNAMILGVSKNSDEMAEMFDVAQRLGRALGRDTKSSVESLITGIGRQSRLMLDNIGIIVKADEAYKNYAKELKKGVEDLTDVEKKQAFLNATMESARAKVALLGAETLSTQDKIAQMDTAISEAGVHVGELATPAFLGFADAITAVAKGVQLIGTTELERLVIKLEEIGGGGDLLEALRIDVLNEELDGLMSTLESRIGKDSFKEMGGDVELLQRAMVRVIDKAKEQTRLTLTDIAYLKEKGKMTDAEASKMRQFIKKDEFRIKQSNDLLAIIRKILAIEETLSPKEGKKKEEVETTKELTVAIAKQAELEMQLLHLKDGIITSDEQRLEMNEQLKNAKELEHLGLITENDLLTLQFKLKKKGFALDKKDSESKLKNYSKIADGLASLNTAMKGSMKVTVRLQQIQAMIDAYAGAQSGWAMNKKAYPFPIPELLYAADIATGLAQARALSNSIGDKFEQGGMVGGRRHSSGGTMIEAEQGEFVMSRNAVDSVGIEAMNRINAGGGAGGVSINFTGNVMSQDFIEDEAIPMIKEAIRRGADIGVA